jgi:hypothetical protein
MTLNIDRLKKAVNSDKKDSLKSIEEFRKNKPTAEWIIKESGIPWLELDIDSPQQDLEKEIRAHKERFVLFTSNVPKDSETTKSREAQAKRINVTDADKHWSFLCMYGIGSEIVAMQNEYPHLRGKNIPHKWTDVADKCPVHKEFLENIINLDNSMIMKYSLLTTGGFLTPHTDADGGDHTNKKMTGLTLMVTNPIGCSFCYENWGEMPIKPGKFYLINANYFHATLNPTQEDRYHLMIRLINRDMCISDIFKDKDIIVRSFQKKYNF